MTAAERMADYTQAPVRFTADEFMELVRHPPIADWTGKVELIGGELVRMAPANIPHWRVQHDTAQRLRSIFAGSGDDWLVGPEPTVRFADRSVRLPDIGVFCRPDLSGAIFAAADLFLAIEVADTSLRTDLGPKLAVYASAAVPHYWVIDLNARTTITMTAPEGDRYTGNMSVPFGEPVPVPGTDAHVVIDR